MRVTIVPDKKYPNMYWVKWPDGTMSVNSKHPERKGGIYGFYNLSWAKEHAKVATEVENAILHPL